jgi:hypothetical protein
METVNNLASAASRAIWGEGNTGNEAQTNGEVKDNSQGQEPVSGEMGDVKNGEPYDKGNVGSSPFPSSSSRQEADQQVT